MKIGDLVRNILPIYIDPVSCKNKINTGKLGVVTKIRQVDYNKLYGKNSPGNTYVDVLLTNSGNLITCGNYLSSSFEVVA